MRIRLLVIPVLLICLAIGFYFEAMERWPVRSELVTHTTAEFQEIWKLEIYDAPFGGRHEKMCVKGPASYECWQWPRKNWETTFSLYDRNDQLFYTVVLYPDNTWRGRFP